MTSDFPSDAERSSETRDTGNDNAFARLEKEMANMRDAIGGLSDQISDAASDIGSVAQEQARRGLKHARANMGSMVNDASDRLGVVANRAQSQASSAGRLARGRDPGAPARHARSRYWARFPGRGDLAKVAAERIARTATWPQNEHPAAIAAGFIFTRPGRARPWRARHIQATRE